MSIGTLQYSERWKTLLVEPFKELYNSTAAVDVEGQTQFCNGLLDVIGFLHIPKDQLKTVLSCLEKLVQRAVKVGDRTLVHVVDTFALGRGLQFLVEKTLITKQQ